MAITHELKDKGVVEMVVKDILKVFSVCVNNNIRSIQELVTLCHFSNLPSLPCSLCTLMINKESNYTL